MTNYLKLVAIFLLVVSSLSCENDVLPTSESLSVERASSEKLNKSKNPKNLDLIVSDAYSNLILIGDVDFIDFNGCKVSVRYLIYNDGSITWEYNGLKSCPPNVSPAQGGGGNGPGYIDRPYLAPGNTLPDGVTPPSRVPSTYPPGTGPVCDDCHILIPAN